MSLEQRGNEIVVEPDGPWRGWRSNVDPMSISPTFTGPWLDIKSMSGNAVVGVTGGCCFDVDFQTLSGEVRTDFPVTDAPAQGPTARLAIKTISGDVEIRAAK